MVGADGGWSGGRLGLVCRLVINSYRARGGGESWQPVACVCRLLRHGGCHFPATGVAERYIHHGLVVGGLCHLKLSRRGRGRKLQGGLAVRKGYAENVLMAS